MVDRYDEELFLEYTEGELSVEKRLAFENQMLQDPRLRNLVAQMVLDRHRLRTMPDETPPPNLLDAVHERLERSMLLGTTAQEFAIPQKTSTRNFHWRRMATLGAMAAMVALVASVFIVTLAQLANDIPLQNMGPGSLMTPGLQPNVAIKKPADTGVDSPEIPSLPPENPASTAHATGLPVETTTAGIDHTDVTPATPVTPAPLTTPQTTVDQPRVAMVPQTLPPEILLNNIPPVIPPDTIEALPASTSDRVRDKITLELAPLPDAQVIFTVSTSNVPAVHKRVMSWIKAYEAKVIDSRELSGDDAADAKPDAKPISKPSENPGNALADAKLDSKPVENHGDTLAAATEPDATSDSGLLNALHAAEETAPVARSIVTISLQDELVPHLETFLKTLRNVEVQKSELKIGSPTQTAWSTRPKADNTITVTANTVQPVLTHEVYTVPAAPPAKALQPSPGQHDSFTPWIDQFLIENQLQSSIKSTSDKPQTALPDEVKPQDKVQFTVVRITFIQQPPLYLR